jgi:hypothetical protein
MPVFLALMAALAFMLLHKLIAFRNFFAKCFVFSAHGSYGTLE